jgi:hypothetical protein
VQAAGAKVLLHSSLKLQVSPQLLKRPRYLSNTRPFQTMPNNLE